MIVRTLAMVVACASVAATSAAASMLLFSPEGNRLNVYDVDTLEKRTLVPSHSDDNAGGRDINGQGLIGCD